MSEVKVAAVMQSSPPLLLLCLVARLHSIAADVDTLAHQLALTSETPQDFDLLELAASKLGLKARQESITVERLHLTPLPALTRLQDGQWAIVAAANTTHVVLQYAKNGNDLSAERIQDNQPVKLTLDEFAHSWLGTNESRTPLATKGQMLLLASRASLIGELSKFDFSWFIPSLVRYRRLLAEVLGTSVVLQLFALVTPLFFQVVMDKVLVHQGISTLNVLVLGLVAISLFESALSFLRIAATVQTRAGQIQVAQASIRRLQDLLGNLRQRESDFSVLASQGFISQHGLQDKTRDRLDIDNELVRVRAEHKTAMAAHQEAIKEQNAYLAEIHKNLSQRLFTAQQDIERLTQEQVKSEQRLHLLELRAPVSGTVQQLAVFTTGGVVTPAQALMVIVPTGHDVAAEVMVANKDIGFVQPGQTVRIKLETYSFTRYGTLDGVVTWVSADALTRDPQNNSNPNNPASNGQAPLAYFPAHIQLKQSSIQIDGKTMPVTPGLNVTAEIKTGKRTVMDYLLSPIQKTLDESVGER